MAAGQGFKTFTTGEVLTAGDVNGYLMQGVLVFASAAARDAAITSPQEGQFAFTKDTNGLWYYDGAAWVASGATGDIEGVTAGVGISGGGTSGTVTITNSMATAIDAKGDLVAGTGADTFAKLTVGANNTVLTADSAEATGLKWAAPAGGATAGIVQVVPSSVAVGAGSASVNAAGTITFSSVTTNLSINGCFTSTYTNYFCVMDFDSASGDSTINARLRVSGSDNSTASSYRVCTFDARGTLVYTRQAATSQFADLCVGNATATNGIHLHWYRPFLADTTAVRSQAAVWSETSASSMESGGTHNQNTSYDGFSLLPSASFSGTLRIYGWSQ